MKVIKRDGRIKDFDFTRIENAVKRSFNEVYPEGNNELFSHILETLMHVFEEMREHVDSITVEEIQDIVVDVVSSIDKSVGDAYIRYRSERELQRNSDIELLSNVKRLIARTNKELMAENANKPAQEAATQRDLIAGEVSKAIAKTEIPKHLIDADDAGAIHIHDKDYWMQGIYNCELVNLDDVFQNGTVINKKKIRTPKSLRTAMTLATQIAAQVASNTYGGQTMSLSHLAPFVRVSKKKIEAKMTKWIAKTGNHRIPRGLFDEMVMDELRTEIKDAVQTFNYQVSTLMTTNGQSPFISVAMYLDEKPEYKEETAMLIEEFLKQRKAGIENEHGVIATQTFPKLLYFMDEDNAYKGSKYYYLTELAAECCVLRMSPDIVSVKKMKEIHGYAFPPMGCRAFLSMFFKDGKPIFYGRGNLGVCSLNLPYYALLADGDTNKFFDILDDYLEMARQVGELRYEKLRGIKADIAPILWQHGAIARLNPDDDILKAVDERGFTVTIGYSGIYETVRVLTGLSHTTDEGFALAERIMRHLRDACETFKANQPHLRFALYGTPQESTTGKFSKALRDRFGDIPDITDKGWVTNSYHVDIREPIDAFTKLDIEGKLQNYSTGGAVSYIETYNMNKNPDAMVQLFQYMYETIIYSEVNFESDVCGECGYEGVMDNIPPTLLWKCPQCGCMDQKKLSVVRRTCGYLGETLWSEGRTLDIINRVKHI